MGVRKKIEKQLQELYDNIGMDVQDLIEKNIDIINTMHRRYKDKNN
nr:hypothetical protein [Clostridium botulinum]